MLILSPESQSSRMKKYCSGTEHMRGKPGLGKEWRARQVSMSVGRAPGWGVPSGRSGA
jgi:hypothetical protein